MKVYPIYLCQVRKLLSSFDREWVASGGDLDLRLAVAAVSEVVLVGSVGDARRAAWAPAGKKR
jgi:hypothetical protein